MLTREPSTIATNSSEITSLPVICLAEDRVSEEVAVRLCIASARRANPDWPIIAYLPNASAALQRWIGRQSQVRLRSGLLRGGYSWDVKPYALLTLLDEGFEEVWWLDSDVLVRRSLAATYSGISREKFLVTEEALSAAYDDDGRRARAWGFEPVRNFHFTLNSGVIRASACHRLLLQRWRSLLESSEYQAARVLDWRVCPAHLLGDQDVLTALLCGPEFGTVDVHVLRRGPDVVQCLGPFCYTLRERLGNVYDAGPSFVHSQGFKPWRSSQSEPQSRSTYRTLLSDTSIYLLEAQRLSGDVENELPWTKASSVLGALLRFCGLGNRILTGLPLAIAGDLARMLRWIKARVAR
jgi:hypothetical protein